jgi:hypothetical protein
VHSAALRSGKIDPTLLRYQGFGIPADLDVVLGCDPWQSTLIFELEIRPTVAYEKASFPMPRCLYLDEDTVKANILMTLVHEPDLDASFGSEYCRSNIEVSLGTYEPGRDGKLRRGIAYDHAQHRKGPLCRPLQRRRTREDRVGKR